MILNFYYHIPIYKKNDKLYLPSFLGVFIESLACCVSELRLIMHEVEDFQVEMYDYQLQSGNIKLISLGKITPAWHRHLFHTKILRENLKLIKNNDFLIVRSPSPLAPFFYRHMKSGSIVYMVVGDYAEGAQQFSIKSIRDLIMIQYIKWNDRLFTRSMKYIDVLVNSPSLYDKYKNQSKSIQMIRTTTLSQKDIFDRKDVLQTDTVNILYTGRFDWAKGLKELMIAFLDLYKRNRNIKLNFAGWEEDLEKPVENKLLEMAYESDAISNVVFHGKKSIGKELNSIYQHCDIYVIPSYHEGFPRTIWEAMGNGLPVIATKVGAIKNYLTHGENAILIDAKNVNSIIESVQKIIDDKKYRMKLISGGYMLANENTLENQTKLLVDKIKLLHE
jgi:glycosyltransferase involved in cell wall biosynthesis